MDSQNVITMLAHLRQYLPEGFILMFDRARIHTGEANVCYGWGHPEIVVEPLPKLAP
jgi:hypothetical protein